MGAGRKQLEPAYVIHRRPYSDTSLIVELLTPSNGRVSVLARGVKRGKSQKSLLLQPFKSLHAAWLGRGELPVLTTAEEAGNSLFLQGEALACGYYINELIYHLVPKHEPAADLFSLYGPTLEACTIPDKRATALRYFEIALLEQIGLSPTLDHDIINTEAIDENAMYYYKIPEGPVPSDKASVDENGNKNGVPVSGAGLMSIANMDFSEPKTQQEAKRLARALIHYHLDGRELLSRALFKNFSASPIKKPKVKSNG